MNIQKYGGGIWRTWFDRDLGLAGKIITQNKETKKITSHLWDSKHAVVCIPNICIHLDRDSNAKFEMNQENHLKLIMGTTVIDQLMGEGIQVDEAGDIFNV